MILEKDYSIFQISQKNGKHECYVTTVSDVARKRFYSICPCADVSAIPFNDSTENSILFSFVHLRAELMIIQWFHDFSDQSRYSPLKRDKKMLINPHEVRA